MDWNDVDQTLFEGTKKEIQNLRCPDCGGFLEYHYYPKAKEMILRCTGECGCLEQLHKINTVPNCLTFFGENYVIKPQKEIAE
jgi:hypothetical protein